MRRNKRTKQRRIEKEALELLHDPRFLYRACRKVGELGVVGEKRNRLVVILASLTRTLRKPASVLVKGLTSSGKSTIVESCLQLFPPSCVVERAGLSGKALAYGTVPLKNRILFLNEYRCGKDSQQFTRLLQSQGQIKHEATTIRGGERKTKTVHRVGMPVVLSTTTDDKVFPDDETRFLSTWVDESADQSRRIVIALARKRHIANRSDLPVWQKAVSMLKYKKGDFEHPPGWIEYVATQLPLDKVRVRRDWDRFLTFCSAVALSRGFSSKGAVDISFPDYCVAYDILEPVFASTLQGLGSPESTIARAVAALNERRGRLVTAREIAKELKWKLPVVYKHLKTAAKNKLVSYEPGTREKNIKPVSANDGGAQRFLPSPKSVFKRHPNLGKKVKYVDPFTGKWKRIRR
jgi:hypothetical protein